MRLEIAVQTSKFYSAARHQTDRRKRATAWVAKCKAVGLLVGDLNLRLSVRDGSDPESDTDVSECRLSRTLP